MWHCCTYSSATVIWIQYPGSALTLALVLALVLPACRVSPGLPVPVSIIKPLILVCPNNPKNSREFCVAYFEYCAWGFALAPVPARAQNSREFLGLFTTTVDMKRACFPCPADEYGTVSYGDLYINYT